MTGRVLLDYIFNIIGTQCFAKLSPSYKVFDLSQRPNGILVRLCEYCELELAIGGLLIGCSICEWAGQSG